MSNEKIKSSYKQNYGDSGENRKFLLSGEVIKILENDRSTFTLLNTSVAHAFVFIS